ncbi:MAG: type III-A CRISPR-associated RAMP protein Csm5 [Promethearchaeota archaeon]
MNCNLKLEVLSPLHIGSGEEYSFLDYYYDDKTSKIFLVDIDKFFSDEQINKKISKILKNLKYKSFEGVCEELNLAPTDYIIKDRSFEYIFKKDYFLEMKKKKRDNQLIHFPSIKKFIRTSGKPYIPGSTLKGAIRTLFALNYISENKLYFLSEIKNYIQNELKKLKDFRNKYRFNSKTAFKNFNKKIFNDDPKKDLLKVLQISDSKTVDEDFLKIIRVYTVGTTRRLPIFIECIPPKTKFELCFKFLNNRCQIKFLENLNKISKEIVNHYEKHYSRNIIKKIPELFKEEKNVLYICIGWGTGWYFKTIGRYLVEDTKFEEFRRTTRIQKPFRNGIFPKTFKVSEENLLPLGWVKISFKN